MMTTIETEAMEAVATRVRPEPPAATGPAPGRGRAAFAAALAVVLALLYLVAHPKHVGDVEEYALMTIAFAQHASPDIRPADIATARTRLPAFAGSLAALELGLDKPDDVPRPGYYRGRDGRVYSIHFFAYPALASLAYKLLPMGSDGHFKCFLAVNLAFVFMLGLALRRLFGNSARAACGVLLFLLCGGYLYGTWSHPETMSASALLAALALYATGAPIAAGLLAGVAATQNPPIVFFAAFAPLLRLSLVWQRGAGVRANLRRAIGPRELLGSTLTGALFGSTVLFNLWAFGLPSIIGKIATATELATFNRLFSYFFDLNQGMLIGVPGLIVALLLGAWRWRTPALAAWAVLFSVALAVPALVTTNWNSGAEGMMRYAFWGAMPLLFAFLWQLRGLPRWPAALVASAAALQLASIVHVHQYNPGTFSPLARWVLAHAPARYNPDPEIFHERLVHEETWLDPQKVDDYEVDGVVLKRLVNVDNHRPDASSCGPERALLPGSPAVRADRNWRYVNGPLRCTTVPVLTVGQAGLHLGTGWSDVEHGGGVWDGAWSQDKRARLVVQFDPRHRPRQLILLGHYYEGNRRTRIAIDGVDLGWQQLDLLPPLAVPAGKDGAVALTVELEFDAPHLPLPSQADQRHLAFFLQKVITH